MGWALNNHNIFFYKHKNKDPGLKTSSYSNLETGLKPVSFHFSYFFCRPFVKPVPPPPAGMKENRDNPVIIPNFEQVQDFVFSFSNVGTRQGTRFFSSFFQTLAHVRVQEFFFNWAVVVEWVQDCFFKRWHTSGWIIYYLWYKDQHSFRWSLVVEAVCESLAERLTLGGDQERDRKRGRNIFFLCMGFLFFSVGPSFNGLFFRIHHFFINSHWFTHNWMFFIEYVFVLSSCLD